MSACSTISLPVTQTISGTTLTVTYEAQSASKGVALEIVKQGLEIVDNVTSTDADKALSAKQGKTLKDLIDGITVTGSLSNLDDVNITDPITDDILIYDGVEEEWYNTPMPNIPTSIEELGDIDITSPSNGQILSYDNGSWINTNAPSGGSQDYTTNETVIGTWDGKPLYRKILPTVTMPYSGGYTYTHNLGIKYYINIAGHCTVNNIATQPLPFPFIQLRWSGYCNIQSTDNNSITFDATWNGNTIDCYIEYTKESDYT